MKLIEDADTAKNMSSIYIIVKGQWNQRQSSNLQLSHRVTRSAITGDNGEPTGVP